MQSTENALVTGQVTLIGPQLTGYVAEVLVQDFQQVKQGDLLVRIDDRIYRQRVDAGAGAAGGEGARWPTASSRASSSARPGPTSNHGDAWPKNAEAQARKAAADLRRIEDAGG